MLTTTALRNLDEVDALRSEWDALLERTPSAEVFRSFEWLRTWWEVFGAEEHRSLLVITVRRGGELVGLAPLLLHPVKGLGPARVRRLEFMGTGEDEADEVCSDFLDVIAAPGLEDIVCQEVWQHLVAGGGDWDVAGFRNILPDALINRFLPTMARGTARVYDSRPRGERFYVDLSGGSFERYVDGLSKKRKKRIYYYRRRLEKEGGLSQLRLERREDIPMFLAETGRLNRLRRNLLGKPSAFASDKFRRFQELVAPRMFDRGWLDMRLWMKGTRCVAALYNFIYKGTISYYQCGFDTPAFGNTSPGLVTLSQVIEWGFGHQQRRFDFLVGSEGSYKEDYDCVTEPVLDVQLYNNTITGQLVRSARGVRELLREARARTRAAQGTNGNGHHDSPDQTVGQAHGDELAEGVAPSVARPDGEVIAPAAERDA